MAGGGGGGALTEAAPREHVDAFADLPSLLAEARADGAVAVEDLRVTGKRRERERKQKRKRKKRRWRRRELTRQKNGGISIKT